MKDLYIFGDIDTPLAIPFRIGETPDRGCEEKSWAKLTIENPRRILHYVSSKFGIGNNGVVEKPVQHIVESLKLAFDEGELSDCPFTLTVYGWHDKREVVTFARTFTQD